MTRWKKRLSTAIWVEASVLTPTQISPWSLLPHL